MECNKPSILEDIIKKEFNKKFKLIAGKEYFEGNKKEMLNTFNNYNFNNLKYIFSL